MAKLILRGEEEQTMRRPDGTCNSRQCIMQSMLGIKGTALHGGACVLCNRARGPGYYSLFDEYSLDDLIPSNPAVGRHGASVVFRPSDYLRVGDAVEQNLAKPSLARTLVYDMYDICTSSGGGAEWTMQMCPSNRCRTDPIVTLTDSRYARGHAPKRCAVDSKTDQLICLKCNSAARAIQSNQFGYVVIRDQHFTHCMLCQTPTAHPQGYSSVVICAGCRRFSTTWAERL
jgi:hypothetical protein